MAGLKISSGVVGIGLGINPAAIGERKIGDVATGASNLLKPYLTDVPIFTPLDVMARETADLRFASEISIPSTGIFNASPSARASISPAILHARS